ncbi:transcriptional repressor CTCFL-like isoform X1 [Aphis gossypii]|uniref:transcriptional repressor CTCFL-like isoform X1 n=2 Tax=Aphis gossypii TaxID=80765 RepID=UPI00100F00AC|nr:transcriptional repressor CTCFL-like isoform X1 [Aphis gossypii]
MYLIDKTTTMSENEGTTIVLDGGSSANTMTIDGTHIKLEASTSGNENITDIQNYLDSFNKEIEGNEVTQVQTDGDSVEHAYFIDQNVQYYYQTTTGDGQMVMVGGLSEHDAQMMAETNDNNMDNVTQIVLPNVQDKIKKDIPQIVALGDGSGYQTVTLVQSDAEANNYVLYVVKQQNDKNDETSNVMDIQQEHDPDDPDASNVYDFNDGEDPTLPKKQEIEDSGEEDDKSKIVKLVPKKSQTVTQAHMCNYCNYTTGKRYLLSRHMKSHSKERPHKCTVCERGFKTLTSLQNHVNTHTGTKPYQCRSCPSAFTTSGELVRHVRYKHTHEKPHKCTICDYASVELSKMRNHMRCHTGERPYQCPHCTYASPDTFKLKRHLRIHTGEKPYECDICFSRFTQSNSLKTHRLIHSGEKPVFKCDHCPATCGRKTDLRIHVQKLHTSDKPIKCKRCGDAFPDRYQYKVHCKSHEGEKCYKCELCPYASMSQRHLETHMLIHTDEKPFHCKQCDQSFRQKQLLRRHHNLYHNPAYIPPPPHAKTHQCNTCQRSFRHKGNLLRHMEVHMQESTGNDRNTAIKQRLEYTDSANEDESEEDTSIPTSETGVVAVEGEDGQQYVVLEVIQLDGQDQIGSYSSSNVSIQQVDQSSSPSQKDLTILKTASLSDVKEECGDGVENCFGFDDEDDEETTNSGG